MGKLQEFLMSNQDDIQATAEVAVSGFPVPFKMCIRDRYICSEIYVFEKDTEEIISLAKQNKVDQRIEMFCDSAEPDRIRCV